MEKRHTTNRSYTAWRKEFEAQYRRINGEPPTKKTIKLAWQHLQPNKRNEPRLDEPVAEFESSRVVGIITDNIVVVRSGGAEFKCLVSRDSHHKLHLIYSLS